MKLCIDPGHGMSNRTPGVYDPGAVVRFPTGSGAAPIEESEAAIVLQIGLTLKWVCGDYGMPFWMTRLDDRADAVLGKRDERAKRECCTHFLSLHCNAGGGSGTETYYRDARDRAFADVVHRCAIEA